MAVFLVGVGIEAFYAEVIDLRAELGIDAGGDFLQGPREGRRRVGDVAVIVFDFGLQELGAFEGAGGGLLN